jgi:hypothetical protein
VAAAEFPGFDLSHRFAMYIRTRIYICSLGVPTFLQSCNSIFNVKCSRFEQCGVNQSFEPGSVSCQTNVLRFTRVTVISKGNLIKRNYKLILTAAILYFSKC